MGFIHLFANAFKLLVFYVLVYLAVALIMADESFFIRFITWFILVELLMFLFAVLGNYKNELLDKYLTYLVKYITRQGYE